MPVPAATAFPLQPARGDPRDRRQGRGCRVVCGYQQRVGGNMKKRAGRAVTGQREQLRRAREVPGCGGHCSGTFARATGFSGGPHRAGAIHPPSRTLHLPVAEAGLGPFITGAINEVELKQAFGLDHISQGALAICGFGWRGEVMETTGLDPAGKVWELASDRSCPGWYLWRWCAGPVCASFHSTHMEGVSMRYLFVLAAVLAMATAFPAWAESASPSLDEIRAQQTELRDAASAGDGIFEDYPRSDRKKLVEKQDAVLAMIEGKQTVDQLDPPVRMDVFNRLEEIRALVEQAEDSRMVCEYEKRIGTNMKTRVCRTVAQQREQMRQAQEHLGRGGNCSGNLCSGN